MKRTLIAAGLAGLLSPGLATAELNYNSIYANYSVTSYGQNTQDQTEKDLGFTKSISPDVFLGAYYGYASLPTNGIQGDIEMNLIGLGAGYHTPLATKDDSTPVDVVVSGHVIAGNAKMAGTWTTAASTGRTDGHDISIGMRAQFKHGLESSLSAVNSRISNDIATNKYTYLAAQFGYNFLPRLQMSLGIDFKRDQAVNVGLRIFY